MASVPLETLERPRFGFIKDKADELTRYYTSPPVPVVDIAHSTSVRVVIDRFEKFGGSVAGFCDFGSGAIFVNAEDPPVQQAYTIAHELGHWVLHREFFRLPNNQPRYKPLPRSIKPKPTDPLEEEARLFAANLLVPKHLLSPVMHKASMTTLAKIFAVTPQTMEYRLKNG